MRLLRRVCVFAGSSLGARTEYVAAARELPDHGPFALNCTSSFASGNAYCVCQHCSVGALLLHAPGTAGAAELEPADSAMIGTIHVRDEVPHQGLVRAEVTILEAEHHDLADRVEGRAARFGDPRDVGVELAHPLASTAPPLAKQDRGAVPPTATATTSASSRCTISLPLCHVRGA